MDNEDNSNWQYKPDGQTVSDQPDLPSSGSSAASKPSRAQNNKVIAWTASEYIDHTRGTSWYLALVVGTIVLAAAVYLITKDYFATGVVGVMGVIVGIFSTHKPKQVTYELSSSGLSVGERVYPLSLFKSFALISEGSLSSISLVPNKRFMPPLSIYLDPADEQKVIDMLGNHLPFEEGGLDTIERLSRRLRF